MSVNPFTPAATRYDGMAYRHCGRSGLQLPAVSLGLWHNFGQADSADQARALVHHAFDRGIVHFDLANNYGPPPGAAETLFGDILRRGLGAHRDELLVSTKAGFRMGPGPYGNGGSRKYLLSSLDQSLQRLGLDHVDIYYHHCFDPHTPLTETMAALDHTVRSGKALYVGLSNYPAERFTEAAALLQALGTPCVIHQPRYNIVDRVPEDGLLAAVAAAGAGCIAYSPLAQGLLTDRYLQGGGIPADSRAARPGSFLQPSDLGAERLSAVTRLSQLARQRGQPLASMALAWVLRQPAISSVLIGASRTSQIDDAIAALHGPALSAAELAAIDSATASIRKNNQTSSQATA